MEQIILDKIIFLGSVNDDLHTKIDLYEKELKESENPKADKVSKKIISALKLVAKIYRGEQKILTFEN